MSKKHKKVSTILNYREHFFIYKLITKKKKEYEKILFLPKTNLNSIEVSISETLTGLFVSHDEFVLVNDMLKEYNEMKEEKSSSVN